MARPGPKRTKQYCQEFKEVAVRLSDLPDVLIKDVAESLEIQKSAVFMHSASLCFTSNSLNVGQ